MWKNTAKGRYHDKMMEDNDYRAWHNAKRMESYYNNAEAEKAKAKEYYQRKKLRLAEIEKQKIQKIDSPV